MSFVGPDGPESIVVSGGVVSTVNERLAGVGSVLLAGSVARTSNVCPPSESAETVSGGGLPGDRIQVKAGRLFINHEPVRRQRIKLDNPDRTHNVGSRVAQYRETLPNGVSYRTYDAGVSRTDDTRVFTVPPDHYFMMGDNRDRSSDSRIWGFVPAVNLVGRADVLFFSTDGSAQLWEFWRWPAATRFGRLFRPIE